MLSPPVVKHPAQMGLAAFIEIDAGDTKHGNHPIGLGSTSVGRNALLSGQNIITPHSHGPTCPGNSGGFSMFILGQMASAGVVVTAVWAW
jgi:hypothetical protein